MSDVRRVDTKEIFELPAKMGKPCQATKIKHQINDRLKLKSRSVIDDLINSLYHRGGHHG